MAAEPMFQRALWSIPFVLIKRALNEARAIGNALIVQHSRIHILNNLHWQFSHLQG
ncbi:hypothetical protein ALT785_340012 [Alteromonas infernus]